MGVARVLTEHGLVLVALHHVLHLGRRRGGMSLILQLYSTANKPGINPPPPPPTPSLGSFPFGWHGGSNGINLGGGIQGMVCSG